MNTEDDERPDVEFRHKDADSDCTTPEETDAAYGCDDTLVTAVTATRSASRLISSLNLVNTDDASDARLHRIDGRLFIVR